jgi:hypothetical protein
MAANNQSSQFVSLELVDGNLVYQFNTGSGLVRMRTTGTYSVGGIWYKVHVLSLHYTRVKISHLVASLPTSCGHMHCLSQVVNKFGTKLLTTLLILSDFSQGCSNKSDTVMLQQYCYNLVSSTL